jgi:lysophospholipase L1-like esterase
LKIIIFDITSYGNNDSAFASELTRQLKENANLPGWLRQAQVVSMENVLKEDLYYVLDDHPTPAGQRAIARELVKYIK